MSKVTNLKRLVKEDFPQENQDLIEKIAFSYNPMTEQLVQAFNKGIDFENLNQEIINFTVEVDSSNVPKITLEIKNPLKSKIRGTQIISVQNTTSDALLNGAPFISYELLSTGFKVKQITGLLPDIKYSITAIIY